MDSEGPNVGRAVRKPVRVNLPIANADRSQLNESADFDDSPLSCFAWHAIG
jgi:hypothetical protein